MGTDACEPPSENFPGDPFFKDFTHLLSSNPAQKNYGVAVTDIDADGSFEFVVAGFGASNQAYKWDLGSGTFKDAALGHPALQDSSGRAIGVAACDVDGDGFEELYVLNTDAYSGNTRTSDKLLDRDAAGEYSDIFSEPQNLDSKNYVAGRSCACLDRTGSGRYGVFVANYGGPMRLFEMSVGSRVVQDAAPDAGMAKTTGGRALIAGPLLTNRMDVFANNEGWSRRLSDSGRSLAGLSNSSRRLSHRKNFVFASNGKGSFADVAVEVGLLDNHQTGRGTAFIDSNGDGLLDIVYGNWNGPHRLYVQELDANGCRRFEDKAPVSMATPSRIRTVIVADFDNDGYEEIFWNNIPGENRLFRKLPGDPDWVRVNIGDALEAQGYGTGAAVGDFNGDGQLELVISHGESASQPLSYFRPQGGQGNHWLRLLPLTAHGAPARGASVTLRAGGRTQTRVIDAGSGYLCQMEPVAHFGLGSLTVVDEVVVTWPDGASHRILSPAIDQLLTVPRPEGLVAPDFQGRCDKPESPAAAPSVPSPTPAPPTPGKIDPSPTGSPTPAPSAPGKANPQAPTPTPTPSPSSPSPAPLDQQSQDEDLKLPQGKGASDDDATQSTTASMAKHAQSSAAASLLMSVLVLAGI